MARKYGWISVILSFLIISTTIPTSVESIGVCYGWQGSNLPPASEVVQLYKDKGIKAMRIYEPKSDTLTALKDTGINLMMDVSNGKLAELAKDKSKAEGWVNDNILAYPGVAFKYIVIGNEVTGNDVNTYNILPAMSKIWDAICSKQLQGKIKVSTALRFDAFKDTWPPSNAQFSDSYMTPIVDFLAKTGNPLFVNVYPFFSYSDKKAGIKLDYALFKSNEVHTDGNYQYHNLFDQMVDSVYHALEKVGGSKVGVVVSESGWPSYGGDEVATTTQNAMTYNQNLIIHVAKYGTPYKPRQPVETYIFAMFNENQKDGDEVEHHFGLFKPDKSPVYPISFI